MAFFRSALASRSDLRSSAFMEGFEGVLSGSSSTLHSGQRLAKPGLPGFNSNSSPHWTQTLIGNGMAFSILKWRHQDRNERVRVSAFMRKYTGREPL